MSVENNPLVNKKVLLEKFPGKGGWTYARIPEIVPDRNNPFGWRKVKGFIDDIEIRQYRLMPMGQGKLFLPVNASIRKKIGKEAGDWVKIILYPDDAPAEIPEEFKDCLKDEPKAWEHFQRFKEQDQKKYIDWIYGVKSEDLKVERMAMAVNKITRGEKL